MLNDINSKKKLFKNDRLFVHSSSVEKESIFFRKFFVFIFFDDYLTSMETWSTGSSHIHRCVFSPPCNLSGSKEIS